ncbi:MAG: TolC family protein [Pseudomonas sp.]|uniref:TolC family protein n=1 Tax=Pseudomonas sp. TaxID=306 RepID=UPI003981A19A
MKPLAIISLASLALSCVVQASTAATPAENYLDLWQLQQEARQADPRILMAYARTQGGAGRKREAYGQFLPQLNASTSHNRSLREDGLNRIEYNGKRYAMSLSQVIYAPQVWRSYQKFSALAEQTEFEYEDAQIQASIDLVERYFSVLAAEDELSLAQSELQSTERNQQRVNALFQRKMAMITDVLELAARVDTLKADVIEASNRVAISRETISELVGREVQEPLKRISVAPAFILPVQPQEYWVTTALASNPALQAREQGVRAADSALGEARAAHLPKLGLSLTAQRSDIGYEGNLTPRADHYVASLDLQVPLYSGGSTSARVVALQGDKSAAEQELEALRRQIIRETRTAYVSMAAGLSRIKATRQALESAEKSRIATEKALAFGVKNAVDVLDSIKEEFRARRDLYQAQYKFITSLLVLHRWSGRLGDADIRRANDWLVIP